ncbi:MAG: response regulator transcription factor [Desulfobacterales bacterium]|nr:MAG: response regulator transcription factor [Desulfobacterales bacterium]
MANLDAIIADDEEHLRIYLKSKLAELWPELIICGEAENGLEALKLIETCRPAVAFLDIKMPGLSGIEVAQKAGRDCRIVFITAFDQYAIEAFENEAVDYILKPVTDQRLQKTIKRLKKQISGNSISSIDFTRSLDRLLAALKDRPASGYLKWIKVRQGEEVRLISVDDICYFKAEDKYTVIKTREGESLIKKTIQQLSEELDPDLFWRIHRGTIISVHQVGRVSRSFAGRLIITLKDLPETLTVSRSYAHLFKQM